MRSLEVFTGFQPGSRSDGITFNQFLIADERPALIHTGMRDLHGAIRSAIREVLDPAKLAYVSFFCIGKATRMAGWINS